MYITGTVLVCCSRCSIKWIWFLYNTQFREKNRVNGILFTKVGTAAGRVTAVNMAETYKNEGIFLGEKIVKVNPVDRLKDRRM